VSVSLSVKPDFSIWLPRMSIAIEGRPSKARGNPAGSMILPWTAPRP
jgi:hypothetical protein